LFKLHITTSLQMTSLDVRYDAASDIYSKIASNRNLLISVRTVEGEMKELEIVVFTLRFHHRDQHYALHACSVLHTMLLYSQTFRNTL